MKIVQIDDSIEIPKYRQIINSICHAINRGDLKRGDKSPSINQICKEFDLSRDTVMVAFEKLKLKGIISSVPGKGYYVKSTELNKEERVFLLFDELNAFKEDLYTSFLNKLDSKVTVDIFFHHFNFQIFKDLITRSAGKYTSYVIMPATFEGTSEILGKLPADKVFILDRMKPDLMNYPVVYQDFNNDIYQALTAGFDLLKKYKKLVMIFPGGKEPEGRMTGFCSFCEEKKIPFEITRSFVSCKVKKGNAYFISSDRNLVSLVKFATKKGFILGKNLGIVSFNDTMLKEVVAGGITTISTDFKKMGETLASMIIGKSKMQIANPAILIRRNSL